LEKQGLDMLFCMFTDVRSAATEMLMAGEGTEEVIRYAFGVEAAQGRAYLPGVVSRKKQVVPVLLNAIKTIMTS